MIYGKSVAFGDAGGNFYPQCQQYIILFDTPPGFGSSSIVYQTIPGAVTSNFYGIWGKIEKSSSCFGHIFDSKMILFYPSIAVCVYDIILSDER